MGLGRAAASIALAAVAACAGPARRPPLSPVSEACVSEVKEMTVRGSSMEGVFKAGENLRAQFGFYRCNDARPGDVVLVNYAGNPVPLLKVVRGIPGDRFALERDERAGGCRIRVNGRRVRNAQGQDHLVDFRGCRMLSLYVDDYRGIIPADAHLVLGNDPAGSLDSTRYGLVDRSALVARVRPQAR